MLQGIALTNSKGEKMGESKVAARKGIAMVTFSRILMASPGIKQLCLSSPLSQGHRYLMVFFWSTSLSFLHTY